MKLHLPKALLTAVLAACVASTTAWAGTWSEEYSNTYNILNGDAIEELSTADNADANGVFIRAGEDSVTANITTLNVVSGKKLTLSAGYPTASYDLASLTIGTLNIANQGSTALDVGTGDASDMQSVEIKCISGSIGALTIGTNGKLTLGEGLNEAKDNKVTFTVGGENSQNLDASGELVVASNATLQFADFDVIKYRSTGQTITLNGGTWEANGTRQSLGQDFTINLINGTIQNTTGRDGGDNGSKYGVIDIAQSGAKIVSSGTSSITGGIRLRDSDLTIEVALGGTLNVDSFYRQGTNNGGIVKKGDGTLKITTMAKNAANEVFYTGNTTMKGGTIEYALTSGTGSYTGTISGTGNVAKSGAGSVTLANVSNLEGNLSVTGGALTITSLSTDKTMNVSVSSGSLSIGSVEVDELNHQLTDISPEGAADTYFTNDGTAHTTSGFKVEDKTYLLFDGYEWNGEVDGFVVGTQDGDTTLIKSGVGTIYYVNDGDTHSISSAGNYINGRATCYIVEQGATLVIDSAQKTIVDGNESVVLSAAQLLTGAIGGGDITLKSNVSLEAGATSQVNGMLTIQDCTVEVDTSFTNTNHDDTKRAVTSLSSFSSVNLDNAVIKYIGKSTSLQNVTVKKTGATLKFNDMGDASGEYYTLAGITQLEGDLTIEKFNANGSAWKYGVKIEQLTGNGNISFTSASEAGLLKIDSLQGTDTLAGYSGAISMTKDAAGAATLTVTTGGSATLSGLSLLSGATAEFINGIKNNASPGGTLGLGAVKMSDGSQLTLTNGGAERTTDITSLEVTGSATIGTKRHGDCYQGTINLNSLTNTGDSATLTLRNGSQIDNATIFNINGGTFKGTINLEADSAKGNNEPSRKLYAYLNNESVAQGAVINFQDPSTETNTDKAYNYITLGVGANTVKVAGLTGTTTNAATIKSTGDSGTRTLEISTAQGADYSTNAKVEASVNLVKSGEGTQTFTSDSIASTSIAVNGGVLALTGLAELQLQDLVVKSGATLNVGADNSGVVMVGSPVAPASTTVSTPSAKLEGGATINGSLNLSNASSLTLDGISKGSLVKIDGDLILPGASETPTLTLSGGILDSLAAMNLGDKLGIFSVGGGFFVGDQVTDALDATNGGIALNTVFSASGDYNFEGYYLGFIPVTDEAGYSTVYIGKIVPEPTTATLSLLALAALAARRRRK